MRIAYELDPASPVINSSLAWIATMNREDDLAFRHVEISKGLGIGDAAVITTIDALVRREDWDAALAALDLLDEVPDVLRTCMQARRDPSLTEQLPTQLDQLINALGDKKLPPQTIFCLALSGQPEHAAKLALTDIEDNWQALWIFWASNQQAGSVRQTAVFRKALKDLGLLDFYRESGWPDLCHPLGEEEFECKQ